MRTRLFSGTAAALLVAGLLSVVSSAAPASASISGNAASAVNYASQHGYRSSIGVVDIQTGAFSGAGDYNSAYASESVMKVFIATRLLMTGQMSGWNETTAYKMVTQSDDASANALYGRTGGDSVITWVKQALNIPNLGSPPVRPGWWGGTQINARGMTAFYNTVRHRSDVWSWLGNAMHHATQYGSDGTYQFFGIPSATTGAGVKQGWGGDNAAGQPAFNSTGFVNSDRYAVVILTQGGTYGSPIAGMVTSEAKLLMPGGRIVSDSPVGQVDGVSVLGRTATMRGWAFDPGYTSSSLRIFSYVNGKPFTYAQTSVTRTDINTAYHLTGAHGFQIPLKLADGTNNVCAYAINLGAAAPNTQLGCKTIVLSGSPVGGVSGVSVQANVATFHGWSLDYDQPNSPLMVRAYVNGKFVVGVNSTVPRPDINQAFKATGLHGYSITVPLPDGASTACVYALNLGPGASTRLGCGSFRLSGSPLGTLDTISVSAGKAIVNGWMFDYDAPTRSIEAIIDVNGKHVAWGNTAVTRGDVNAAYGITGAHGYSYQVTLAKGTNRVCVTARNYATGTDSSLGCRTVTG